MSARALCLGEAGWHFLGSAQIRRIVFLVFIGTSTYYTGIFTVSIDILTAVYINTAVFCIYRP